MGGLRPPEVERSGLKVFFFHMPREEVLKVGMDTKVKVSILNIDTCERFYGAGEQVPQITNIV